MKIIQVMPEFALAGAEIMCESLCYELVKKGHDVKVISMYTLHTPITDRLEKAGIDVRYLDKKPGFDFSIFRKMRKLFKAEKPDVIHTHRYTTIYAIPSSMFCSIKKKIHTMHSIAQKENNNMGRRFNKIFFKLFSVIPVALSSVVKESTMVEYGLRNENVPVVLNGMPLEKYVKKIDYSVNDRAKIIHIGRFATVKNHTRLIEAFEKVCNKFPDTILNLYGEGELFSSTKKLVEEKGMEANINFCGVSDDIASELSKNDIFCLPSDYEGVPMTLIEAMASAMPIVATSVGGVPDMLTNGTDALLTETTTDAVANALCDLISSEELRKTLGQNALKRSFVFSAETMAQKYIEIYEDK